VKASDAGGDVTRTHTQLTKEPVPMKKTALIALPLAALIGFGAAACSSDDDSSSSPTTTSAASTEARPSAPPT